MQKTGLIQKYNNAIGKVIEISALYTTHAPKFSFSEIVLVIVLGSQYCIMFKGQTDEKSNFDG